MPGVKAMHSGAKAGFYMAFSKDGIHWPRDTVQQIWKTPVIASLNRPVAWHPTLVLDDGTKPNEIKGWLYYGYSENWGHHPPNKPHYLVRRPISFTSPCGEQAGSEPKASKIFALRSGLSPKEKNVISPQIPYSAAGWRRLAVALFSFLVLGAWSMAADALCVASQYPFHPRR